MPKRSDPGRRGEPHDTGSVDQQLARLLEAPRLARLVPHLAPETLHQIIRYRGLDACGELVASATPEQLRSVLDLDLWGSNQPGRDHRFDEARFGEWLELLVDAGGAAAASTVAAIDTNLVVAGLARHVRVFDPATFAPAVSSDDEPFDLAVTPSGDLACEVGGYLVRAKRSDDAWDAIVMLLTALDADHHDYFHAVMRGCRRLSHSTPEIDGLDDLLMAREQLLHEVALEREHRRSQQGYLSPADARAFLQMAKQPRHQRPDASAGFNPVVAAYFRAADEETASADSSATPPESAIDASASASISDSIDAVVDLLAEAGLVPGRPRALIEGTAAEPSPLTHVRRLMEHVRDTDDAAHLARSRELAFLANTLMAGCSVQERPFTAQEASDAALGICNLGLEHWPEALPDPFLVDHDLVTAFELGWAVLHQDVSLFVTDYLIGTLSNLESVDAELQRELYVLRRELMRQRDAGAPWRARHALEVIAMLDGPAWASLRGLLDECPVLPAALRATVGAHTGTVSATAFEFISTTSHLGEIRAFVGKLPEVLLR
jgi:hypothetical protein